jgi:putative transposase
MLPGETYHVYNRANGNEKLFVEERNYYFFLDKLSYHILPVINMHAYCLMPNHFHLLVEVKSFEELQKMFSKIQNIADAEKQISKSFSNLFSSYTQAFNKVNDRMGNLFMSSFKKKHVENTSDYLNVTHYIHANPVHHKYVENIKDWKFSSYKALAGFGKTSLKREAVHNIFGGQMGFIEYHKRLINPKEKFLDC